jgi:FMN phosphatase YigB (HAD superfamily)
MRCSPHEIRALIFDFGGVLVRTESHEPREELARQVGLSRRELYDAVFNCEESRLAQLGRMSSEDRWQRIGQVLGINSPQELMAFRRRFFAGDVLDAELVAISSACEGGTRRRC